MKELLADLCHRQWSRWMGYLFSKCKYCPDGSMIIPQWAVKRWSRQLETQYSELSPEEMDSDRKEADRFIALFKMHNYNKQQQKDIHEKHNAVNLANHCKKYLNL